MHVFHKRESDIKKYHQILYEIMMVYSRTRGHNLWIIISSSHFFFQFWFFNMDIHKATIDNCLENVKEVK